MIISNGDLSTVLGNMESRKDVIIKDIKQFRKNKL